MNNISRLSLQKVLAFLKDPTVREVLIVEGARQVGKTTLVLQALSRFPQAVSINLEENKIARSKIDSASSFEDFSTYLSSQHGFNPNSTESILFIDEAQESDQLGSFVRFMKERWSKCKVILSGSSMTRLFRPDQRVPVGRYLPLQIGPLTFREFVQASGKSELGALLDEFDKSPGTSIFSNFLSRELLELFDTYLTIGGLPAVVAAHFGQRDARQLRTAILLAQEEDFVRKSSLPERAWFSAGLKGVANYLGMPAKRSHIHEKPHLAEKIISVEVAWHLILEIEQHSANSTSTVFPKRYLYDLGIAQEIRGMPFPHLSLESTRNPVLRTQLGGIFENALLLQVTGHQNSLSYLSGWKKSPTDPVEVDFVWRPENLAIPVECKASLKIGPRSFSSLRQYLRLSGLKCGILVSAAPFAVFKEEDMNLINIPIFAASGTAIIKAARIWG